MAVVKDHVYAMEYMSSWDNSYGYQLWTGLFVKSKYTQSNEHPPTATRPGRSQWAPCFSG
ncbi:hypothetical protein J6590_079789 [Homalodisca vitripennis]|nr:hypothetical protein J6590_079789 [Homalodisca vitripennis]